MNSRDRVNGQEILAKARKVARVTRREMPWIDAGDAESAAVAGALEAYSRYSAEGGSATFSSYSDKRIKGAILDDLEAARFIKKKGREKGESATQVELTEDAAESLEGPGHAYLDMVEALKSLSERERYILLMLAAGYKLNELAPVLGVSIVRVSQVAIHARRKIHYLNEE